MADDDRMYGATTWLSGLKREGSTAVESPSRGVQHDSNSNPISPEESEEEDDRDPIPSIERPAEDYEGGEEAAAEAAGTSLEPCQTESYHWCEEDDLTSSEAATSTDRTLGSSGDQDHRHHSSAEYVEIAKKVDTNLAHIDMEDFKSADLFQSEQIRSLLIEFNRPASRSQSPLSQDDCSLTDCGSICKSGPLFSPQRGSGVNVSGIAKSKTSAGPGDYSTDSLNLAERDECWLLEEAGDATNQLLCRTNMTNYTLAWSSSASGTDHDLDYNEPGTSSSGSEQSHWSSSGSGGGGSRVAPPIPPWPVGQRQSMKPSDGPLQCWITQQTPLSSSVAAKKVETGARKDEPKTGDKQQQQQQPQPKRQAAGRYAGELIDFGSIGKSLDDNPSLSDMDNGNGKAPSPAKESSASPRPKPVFTPLPDAKNSPPPSSGTQAGTAGLSLLQIYMRQRSQTSMERDQRNKKPEEVIASGGGEGWVEDYPSSADEKLGLGSISSSLADDEIDNDGDEEDESSESQSDDDDDDDNFHNNRSLTLTDVSDIEQTSIQIDAVPFNSNAVASSLDKLIAKIKPFELGLSPASIEEHWNFESRMRRMAPQQTQQSQLDKSCQAAINPATSATQEESTLTDPVKPQAYVIFPSYSLPDLSFLKKHDYTWIGDVLLSPQNLPTQAPRKPDPPVKQKTFDDLKRREMSHVKDWESLKILLPEEIRQQINSIKPAATNRPQRPRPKSCDNNVVMREKKTVRPAAYRGSAVLAEAPASYALPTVPQSPTEAPPPPLPKRTASLPHGPNQVPAKPAVQRRPITDPAAGRSPGVVRRVAPVSADASSKCIKGPFGYTMRKTVSFGEHLSGGFLKMANQKRPLSLSHWSGGGSFDIDDREGEESAVIVNMEQKKDMVRAISSAADQLVKVMNQSLQSLEDDNYDLHSKLVARCLTGQLSPAIYQLLSDGLLPNVTTFFGQVSNSVWRVVEASVKKGPVLPWIEELVFCLNSEESLPEGPVRFGVFITELVNMGGLDWWLDNLSTKETILRRHYAPNGFLYLCHTTTRPLMEELQASLRPLASLPFDHTPPTHAKSEPKPASPKPTTPTKTILKSPTRAVKPQRPLSYVQNSPTKSPKPQYRRTQSQHSGLSPKKSPPPDRKDQKGEPKIEQFSSLKQKWESMCKKKPAEPANSKAASPMAASSAAAGDQSPIKSRIPRPVFRFSK